ncbi:helix-turn-helix domain-containing protein [Nonomuraea sp. B5E05]|uniref:helix-turn-helix domain-containing protein n=1 Tax=Nonomuraea sp. B5E05 TaxID=3153569 RepID=UPI003261B416
MTILAEGLAQEQLLLPSEVADVFRVHPETIRRWVRSGRLKAVPTPGGRLRRFRSTHIAELLAAEAVA